MGTRARARVGELPAERAKATFAISDMTEAVYGGADAVRRRNYILGPLKGVRLCSFAMQVLCDVARLALWRVARSVLPCCCCCC